MSGVPKSRRNEHDFVASHKLKDIRKRITELAIYDFGYDRDRLEEKIQKFADANISIDPERRAEIIARMRAKNESYYADFVEEETVETRKMLRMATCEFELGNSIFPTGETKITEFCERRRHFDSAIGWLDCLKQELQYIAETLPGDKNRYEGISNDIKEEISLIKGVRRAANKFLSPNKNKKKPASDKEA